MTPVATRERRLNGLDVDGLEDVMREIAQDPARGQVEFRVTGARGRHGRMIATVAGHAGEESHRRVTNAITAGLVEHHTVVSKSLSAHGIASAPRDERGCCAACSVLQKPLRDIRVGRVQSDGHGTPHGKRGSEKGDFRG